VALPIIAYIAVAMITTIDAEATFVVLAAVSASSKTYKK
jgi:hypothetical protein